MDETQQTQPTAGQVMDIAPASSSRQQPSLRPAPTSPEAPSVSVSSESSSPSPQEPNMAPAATEAPELVSEADNHNDAPAEQGPPTPAAAKPRHKLPIATIVIAVVVALSLASTAVFAYLQQDDKPVVQAPTPQASQVNQGTVDDVQKEIDNSLNGLSDDTDFNETDLSDDTLGL